MLYQPLYIGPLCIYGRLNTEDNSSDNSLSQQTQLVPMIPQQRTGTIYRSQWSSGSAPDFSVREPLRIILPALHLSRPPLRYAVLGTGCCTVPAVPRSTQPSNRRGTVKWVSAFGLSNNNKWRWWMWMVAAYYQQTLQPKSVGLVWGLAASWRSVCIHQMNHGDSTINMVMVIIIIILFAPFSSPAMGARASSICNDLMHFGAALTSILSGFLSRLLTVCDWQLLLL